MELKKELEQRGFIKQITNENVFDIYEQWWQKFYCGYDPTADSLHLWHMVTIMAAINFMKKWNTFYLLIWWATGMIWDPSFKEAERNFLDEETLRHNQKSIWEQMNNILTNLQKLTGKDFNFKVVNNYDFFKDLSVLDFLRNVWKHITVNTMIAKETIKKRIEDPNKSISYTEFTYTLLQWYDFYKLCKDEWLLLQLAWSDQRWNITTWTELIRKKLDKEVYWITVPLILDSTGKKFWKSEWNAIRLDPNKNSPYYAYQYFMNATDDDIERFLKLFTLLNFEQIENIIKTHKENPEKRYWQTQLANYVIETIFWNEASLQAQKISEILFSKENKIQLLKKMNQKEIQALCKETWNIQLNFSQLPIKILDLSTQTQLTKSNWEAKKIIQAGSIYLNEDKVTDLQLEITKNNLINWETLLLRKWKKIFKTIIFS